MYGENPYLWLGKPQHQPGRYQLIIIWADEKHVAEHTPHVGNTKKKTAKGTPW